MLTVLGVRLRVLGPAGAGGAHGGGGASMPLCQLTQRPLSFTQAACLVTQRYRREMEVKVHHLSTPPPPPASPGEKSFI